MNSVKFSIREYYRKTIKLLHSWGYITVDPDISETFGTNSSIGCDCYKCIFIHIPKTGGISICKDLRVRNNHMTALQWQRKNPYLFSKYFKFTFARHPVKRFISSYNYLCHSTPLTESDAQLGKDIIRKFESVEQFIEIGLEDMLNHHMFKPQVEYIRGQNKQCIVDFIGKMENYDNDRELVYARIGLKSSKTKKNVSKRKLICMSKDMIRRIEEVYKGDMETFGY